tara:strand:- start:46 stop:309 length:264 start_codon:yes stop_codon:yes gene_type:complete
MPNVFLYFLIIFFILLKHTSFAENIENEIKYEVGKAYKIKDKWYYPKNDLDYIAIGIASVNSKKKKKKKHKMEKFFQIKKYLQNIKL